MRYVLKIVEIFWRNLKYNKQFVTCLLRDADRNKIVTLKFLIVRRKSVIHSSLNQFSATYSSCLNNA